MSLSTFLQSKSNIFLVKVLPLSLFWTYLYLLGQVYYLFNPREKESIKWNILRVFIDSTSPQKISAITRDVFRGIFYHYAEKLINAYYGFARIERFLSENVSISGGHILEKEIRKGNKVVLVTGHFGGVEFLPVSLAFHGFKVAMMVHYKTPELKKTLEDLAQKANILSIDVEAESPFRKAISAINEGYALITECDEVEAWKPEENEYICAFNREVLLDRAINVLQRKTGAVILMVFVRRIGNFKYALDISRPEEFPETADIPSAQGRILKIFERYVVAYPDQWYEFKKFHRMLKDQGPASMRKHLK